MSGSSNDHVLRDGDRPDEMDDIFSTLSSQLSVLYGILTNNPRRMVFMDQLQDIVVANADSIVRWATGGPPQKAMPKNNAKESTTLRPRDPSTAFRPRRPPRSSIMWRPSVATFVTSPPPLPPPPKSPPSSMLEMPFLKVSFDTIADLVLVRDLEVVLPPLCTSA